MAGIHNSRWSWNDEMSRLSDVDWSRMESPTQQHYTTILPPPLASTNDSLNSVMDDFRRNGVEAPLFPEETERNNNHVPMVPKSWSPSTYRTPRPLSMGAGEIPMELHYDETFDEQKPLGLLSKSHLEALMGLSTPVINSLLRDLQTVKNIRLQKPPPLECRFCKNNGEAAVTYGSHALKDGAGRVLCPVLRAYTCARCGASGSNAHTLKYCPQASLQERMHSAAIMQCVRRSRLEGGAGGARGAGLWSRPGPGLGAGAGTPSGGARSLSFQLDQQWVSLAEKLKNRY